MITRGLSPAAAARWTAFRFGLRRLASPLFRFRATQMTLVLGGALLVRGSRLAERDRDRLTGIFDLFSRSGA
jgi:hypothetical protein